MRFLLTLWISKFIAIAANLIDKKRGSSFSGKIAIKLMPDFVARFQKIDYDKVYELYKKKMSDGQIAVKVGCDRTSIRHWRNRNGLEANFKTPGSIGKGKRPTSEISKLDKPKFFKMHENGASDKEIADAAGVQKHTARSWRLKNSLPMNDSRGRRSTIDNNKVLKLYEAGKMDREIAEQIGVHLTAIAAWRKKRGLEANRYRNARRI